MSPTTAPSPAAASASRRCRWPTRTAACLVGAFIVVEGDEILSITSGGQVVRSPIDEQFRATGRSTMGVKFVTPKGGDSVAVVARSVERDSEVHEAVEEALEEAARSPRCR